MRFNSLLLVPIVSVVGISLAIHLCGSIIIDLVSVPFNKRNKNRNCSNQEDEEETVVIEMWKCRKCNKPVYFAERKCSLGYDWHPQCLKCEECGKRLNPGQHAEHKGVPYCYIPCYGALFGPTLYGHGSQVESHASFGKVKQKTSNSCDGVDKTLEAKLKEYNQFYDGKSGAIHYRERNGKLILEGAIRIYWDVSNVITLKEDNDDRVFVKKRSSYYEKRKSGKQTNESESLVARNRASSSSSSDTSEENDPSSVDDETPIGRNYNTFPVDNSQKEKKQVNVRSSKSFDDEYVQKITESKMNQNENQIEIENDETQIEHTKDDGAIDEEKKKSSTIVNLRRKSGNIRRSRVKLKRRCSINGHYYNRETSKFTPAPGSITSVYITSMVNPTEVINMLLDKFKVTNKPEDFALFVVKDNGECKKIQDNEFPLIVRVKLGPNEDVAKFFILNKRKQEISNEVAQYLHFSNVELQMFLRKFEEEEMKEVERIKNKYDSVKDWIRLRMKELQL